MMAELMGRETGYCRGLGGWMHIAALDLSILGCNGIVAAGLPIGTGAALAARLRKSDVVVTIFFGDGGANQGTVHESMNLAAIWNLPVVFLCENNHYALSTSSKRTTAGEGIAARSGAYGFPGVRVDGNDVLEVYQAMRHAVARARSGKGPTLLEAVTYRWGDHSMRANLPGYRTKDEELEWQRRDPLARFEMRLIDEKLVAADRLKQIRNEVEHELEEAVAFGVASAEPTVEIMESSVYAPHIEVSEPARPAAGTREITFVQALNEAMHGEMARDPRPAGRRHPSRRSALPEPGSVVHSRSRARGRRAVDGCRRQRPADVGHPRRQPRDLPRAQGPLCSEGPGARGPVRDPARQGRRQARRHRRHRHRHPGDGPARAGRRRGAGQGRDQRRGHRPADACPPRRGDDPVVGGEDGAPRGRPRSGQARRLRRRGRGARQREGARLARRAHRARRRPSRAHALQRRAGARDHSDPGGHRSRGALPGLTRPPGAQPAARECRKFLG